MKKLNLTNLKNVKLNSMMMTTITGGEKSSKPFEAAQCGCACKYAKNGGKSVSDNGHANSDKGLSSPGKCDHIFINFNIKKYC